MTYTSALFTSTNDITTEEWNRLYADSLASMDAGSTPWNIYTANLTAQGKKDYMWGAVEHAVSVPDAYCFTTRLDGYMIQLALGTKDGTEANLYFALYGKNKFGSKSWVHDDNWHAHSKEFFAQTGANTLVAKSVPGGPMDTYVNEKALTKYSGFSPSTDTVVESGPNAPAVMRNVRSNLS
tara:strand:+ start:316 stop:858 length:543 start_codon:yes stop_codon:yes gene_type:complete